MVNRVLQAKRVKMKRMRRAYLNSPKHAGPNVSWTAEYHARAKVTTDYERWFYRIDHIPDDVTRRVDENIRSLLIAKGVLDSEGNRIELSETVKKTYREEIVERMRLFIDGPVPLSVVLINAEPAYVLLMFWSSGQHRWWFVKKDMEAGLLLKSRKFDSREKAMRDFNYEIIKWIDAIPLTF